MAVIGSSVVFGFWHIAAVINDGARDGATPLGLAVVGTLLATTVAGLGFAWLRVRSQSLVAPILAHLATNSLTFAASWIVSR